MHEFKVKREKQITHEWITRFFMLQIKRLALVRIFQFFLVVTVTSVYLDRKAFLVGKQKQNLPKGQ